MFIHTNQPLIKISDESALIRNFLRNGRLRVNQRSFFKEIKDFMDYQFGIYEGGCSSDPNKANHGVLIVGYDERKI